MNTLATILGSDDYIQEGVNPAPGVVILACTVGDDYDDPQNRILVLKDGIWLDFDLPGDPVLSVDAMPGGIAWVLGENGSVFQFDWLTPTTSAGLTASGQRFENPEVDELGPLRRIRLIGDEVICAGSVGQAYRLRNGNFDALPPLILHDEELTIEDLCGPSPSDFIAVTTDGYGAHFDGSAWHELDLPRNVGFNRICRMQDGRYAITGYSGTLIIGRPGQWDLIPTINDEVTYYGVAASGNDVFLASLGDIFVFDGAQFRRFPIPAAPDQEFGVLRSGPDGVWSFTGHTVGVITASGWRRLP